ncbi:MAG TPA: magnesium chelatase, partial [Spirochaetota bacterium]|nr:magnesium chelatase [Spirochaetota bacterium]
MRSRIAGARTIQMERFADSATRYNSRMTQHEIKRFCRLDRRGETILESAISKMSLTARSFFKILRVSRTIADLEASGSIEPKHLLEALSYKNLQRNYEI